MKNKFKVGDFVKVRGEYEFFTTFGILMVIAEVLKTVVDGETHTTYLTSHPCRKHGPFYNEFELIAA